jgi:hypothetical protein
MGQGEDIPSASRSSASVEFTIPSGKSLAWSYCLPTKGVRMRSSVCVSNWSSCVPNNLLEFARVARPTRKSDALLLAAQPERWASSK